jgi:hypothetical protein
MGAASVILVGTRDAAKSVSVWGLAADGSEEWTYDTGATTYAIVQDSSGNVYVGGAKYDDGGGDKNVWKLSTSGVLIDDVYVSTMSNVWDLAVDDTYLYVAGTGAYRLNLDLTNETLIASGNARQAIGVDSSGNVYVGGGGLPKTITKYNSSLTYQFDYDTNDTLHSIDFLANQDVIVGTGDGEVRMYEADGSSPNAGEWAYVLNASGPNARARVYNDVIYASRYNGSGSGDGFVVLNSSGVKQWGLDYATELGEDLGPVAFNGSGVPFVCGEWIRSHNVFEVDDTAEEIRGIMTSDYALGYYRGMLVDSSYSYTPDLSDAEGQWTLNDNAGNQVVEEAAYGRDGTASRNTSIMATTGKVNGALAFVRADNDDVDLGDNAAWELTSGQDKTYAFWCNWTQNGTNNFNVIMNKYEHAITTGFATRIQRVSKDLRTTIWWPSGGGSDDVTVTGLDLDATGWFLTVIRVDRSGNLHVSINNGAYENVVDISANETDDLSNANSLMLAEGMAISVDYERFQGDLDNVGIWNRLLTEEEEDLLWNSGGGSEDFGLNIAPVITDQSASSTIAIDEAVSLSVTATGEPAPTYQWYKDASPLSGETNSTLNFTAVADSGGIYTCTATNVAGSDTSDDIVLSMLPNVISQTNSTGVTRGTSATLTITASGYPAPTYQWYKDDVLISGETSATLTKFWSDSDAGTYKCVLTNAVGSTNSADIVVTIVSNPYVYNLFNLPFDLYER